MCDPCFWYLLLNTNIFMITFQFYISPTTRIIYNRANETKSLSLSLSPLLIDKSYKLILYILWYLFKFILFDLDPCFWYLLSTIQIYQLVSFLFLTLIRRLNRPKIHVKFYSKRHYVRSELNHWRRTRTSCDAYLVDWSGTYT